MICACNNCRSYINGPEGAPCWHCHKGVAVSVEPKALTKAERAKAKQETGFYNTIRRPVKRTRIMDNGYYEELLEIN